MAETNAQLVALTQRIVIDKLSSKGYPASVVNGDINLGVGDLSLGCFTASVQQHARAVLLTFATELKLKQPAIAVRDTTAGVGSTVEQAISKGAETWLEGVLPTVLSTLSCGQSDLVQMANVCQIDTAKGLSNEWELFSGPYQVAGRDRDHLAQHLDNQKPFFFMLKEGYLPILPLNPPYFWASLFLSRQASGEMISDCKINNVDWAPGCEALERFAWPTDPGFLMFRQFVMGKLRRTQAVHEERKWWQVWK